MLRSNPFRLSTCAAAAIALAIGVAPATAQSFEVGAEGIGGNNQWPGAENPTFAIDGTTDKALIFDDDDTFNLGFAITASGGSVVATNMQVWTANDETDRDPTSYQIWGSNTALTGAETSISFAGFTQVATGALAPPAGRNASGQAIGTPGLFSETVSFANATAYSTYIIYFPTVNNAAPANSMQIAELQLFEPTGAPVFASGDTILGGDVIPEPGSLALLGLGGFALLRRRR